MLGSKSLRIILLECLRSCVVLILLSAVMFGVTLISTGRVSTYNGSPTNELQGARFESIGGFDRSPGEQYFVWVGHLIKGDWETIYNTSTLDEAESINQTIKERFIFSTVLAVVSLVLASAAGFVFGSVIAAKPSQWYTKALVYILDICSAIPDICIALGLVLIFAVTLRWLPSAGYISIDKELTGFNRFTDIVKHMLIPVITLSLPYSISLIRTFQTLLREILFKDYIRTARAKGLNETIVVIKHGLRNCMVPYIANVLALVPFFLTGVIIVEMIFLLPGLGNLIFNNVRTNIYIIVVIAMIVGIITIISSSISRVIFRLIDPRLEFFESVNVNKEGNRLKTIAAAAVILTAFLIYSTAFIIPPELRVIDYMPDIPEKLLIGLAPAAIITVFLALFGIKKGKRTSVSPQGGYIQDNAPKTTMEKTHSLNNILKFIMKRSILILHLAVFVCLLFAAYRYDTPNLKIMEYHRDVLLKASPPSIQHPMGLNGNGQDILELVLVTMKNTLTAGLAASALVCVIGGLLGIISAYLGGAVEKVIGLFLDLVSSIPFIFMIITAFYLISATPGSVAVILALTALPEIANVVKITAQEIRTEEFVTASVAMGATDFHVIGRHIWPNLIGLLLVQGVSLYSRFTLMMASLGYVGILSFASWGYLVQWGQREIFSNWWSPIGPALGLIVVITIVNGIGRNLNELIGEKVRIDG